MMRTLKSTTRILGITSLFLFVFIYNSDWRFNNSWLPTLLLILISISILFEIYTRIKSKYNKWFIGIFFLIIFGLVSFLAVGAGAAIDRNFLSFRSTVYENDDLTIERSKGISKVVDTTKTAYYLLEYGLGKSLVKPVETTFRFNHPLNCEIHFKQHTIIYDVCVGKFYP